MGWLEKLHPRSDNGRFRSKAGGMAAWASRISDSVGSRHPGATRVGRNIGEHRRGEVPGGLITTDRGWYSAWTSDKLDASGNPRMGQAAPGFATRQEAEAFLAKHRTDAKIARGDHVDTPDGPGTVTRRYRMSGLEMAQVKMDEPVDYPDQTHTHLDWDVRDLQHTDSAGRLTGQDVAQALAPRHSRYGTPHVGEVLTGGERTVSQTDLLGMGLAGEATLYQAQHPTTGAWHNINAVTQSGGALRVHSGPFDTIDYPAGTSVRVRIKPGSVGRRR